MNATYISLHRVMRDAEGFYGKEKPLLLYVLHRHTFRFSITGKHLFSEMVFVPLSEES